MERGTRSGLCRNLVRKSENSVQRGQELSGRGVPVWYLGIKRIRGQGYLERSDFWKLAFQEAAEKEVISEARRSPVDRVCVVWPPGSGSSHVRKDPEGWGEEVRP